MTPRADSPKPIAAWVLAGILVMTSCAKLLSLATQRTSADGSALLVVAVGASAEIVIAAALLTERHRRLGVAAATILAAVFAVMFLDSTWDPPAAARTCGCLGSAPLDAVSRGMLVAAVAAAALAAAMDPSSGPPQDAS